MKALCLFILVLVPLAVVGHTPAASARKAKPKPDLVLRAKVIRIFPNRPPGGRYSHYNWVIRTRVLKVLRGQFKARVFEFRVHSPSKSNLSVGKIITVRAWRVKGGYRVDPWRRY